MDPPGFDLVAASLRADTSDLSAFVEALADRLSGAFGDRVRVERQGNRFARVRRVRRLALDLGDGRFELEHDSAGMRCRRQTLVRGVAIRGELLPVEAWLDELARALVVESESSAQDRAALQRLLE